ncbi:hypothetical protein LUZ61_020627 [Rhynchospora tenuis]|uniref:Cupin type-1 domain-containing protein n=1 Tax=Rhynchospora tenuis TaxID=198213 RepID=A0AAD5ZDF7_9POAL|nr:hypothetical protein LUZ61_020627 [Rhynchospora tenuis]
MQGFLPPFFPPSDGSWVHENDGGSGIAYIFFSNDNTLIQYQMVACHAYSPFHAEFLALNFAVKAATAMGIHDVCFFTDCLQLCNVLIGVSNVDSIDRVHGIVLSVLQKVENVGRGFTGPIFPGCPETYQSFHFESGQSERQQRLRDSHQQVHRFREGDVLAFPAGVSHWCYNDGDIPVVAVQVFDISSTAYQLEPRQREFLVAGNRQGIQQSFERTKQSGDNIFSGFDTQLLAEALGVNHELASRLQSSARGQIWRGLQFIQPSKSQEQHHQQQQEEYEESRHFGRYNTSNGLEETFCHLKLEETSTTRLRMLCLLPSGMSINAHSVMYVTGGQGRVQVVNHRGKTVFDGQLRQGQILIIPQNYAVLKRAQQQGFEWVSFKTNPNAMVNKIAGKASTIQALPLDVVANSYRITREQAWRLKNSRRNEMSIFTPLPLSHRELECEKTGHHPQYKQEEGSSQYSLV